MLLVNKYVDYYSCYNKSWSIVESEFLIWTNIYFELTSELIDPHLIDVMSWVEPWDMNMSFLLWIWTYGMSVRIPMLIG
jgi:hypothetical protein